MNVFKFGGASVNSVERIHNLAAILRNQSSSPLIVIISAMGKTTNALEKVVTSFYGGRTEEALQLFEVIKQQHLSTAKYLLVTHYNNCYQQLTDFFTEVEWLLHDKPVREFDYYYDQVVCVGELMSTAIISHYLNEAKIPNQWIDVRDVIRTDNRFRDANVDLPMSTEKIQSAVQGAFLQKQIILTQGFIGATIDNESTTLGREGSDYTAALFANMLNASALTIWKDVAGVMNADPKQFPDAQVIPELSFNEVIEMAYYGAQVIHPKTIKPLHNKKIPLYVKCFIDPSLPGTVIQDSNIKGLPPIIVVKKDQVLMHLHSKDFSFVGEQPMSDLYELFAQSRTRPNLIQTGAISVQICLDDHPEKIMQLAGDADTFFDVQVEKKLTLLTIRHYTPTILAEMIQGKEVLLTQQTRETVQIIHR